MSLPAGPMLLIGIIIASHPTTVAPSTKTHTVNFHPTAAIQTAPAPTDATTADPATTDSQAAPTDQTAPADQQAAPADDQSPPADPPADPVVATDAEITDWSDAVSTDSRFSDNNGKPLPTFVSYRYCIWTYSDGTTQQQVYETKYATADGAMSYVDDATFGCSLTTAP